MTPGAEFNTYADSVASARVFALTSPNPRMTMPPIIKGHQKAQLPPYPEQLSRQLTLKLFPLDITEPHLLLKSLFDSHTARPEMQGSPLAEWANLFLTSTFAKALKQKRQTTPDKLGLQLHDPLTIWYALTAADPAWTFKTEDIRVETSGQWTRGCVIVDRRGRPPTVGTGAIEAEVIGDAGGWRDSRRGNCVQWCVQGPGVDLFGGELLRRVFGEL